MKKIVMSVAVLVAVCSAAFAQKDGLKFSAGPEIGFAIGDFSSTHSLGIGASGQLEFGLQDKLNFTATAGFITFSGKSIAGTNVKFQGQAFIPVRAGAKYFFTTGIYGAAQLGVAFLNNGGGTAFSYSPQLGYEFKTKNDKAVDATFKFEGFSKNGSLGALAFRLAYVF
jgi:hypothetical protein